jgi:hypothetical protein
MRGAHLTSGTWAWWPWAAVACGYTAVVVLMLAPLSNYAAFSTAIAPGDPKLLAWTFAWTSHAILTGAPLFNANIFYPAQPSLAFAEHHIGVGIWGLPLFALTGNGVLVYSVLRIAALTLDAVSMHLFVWRWLRSRGAALVAGLIFSVSSPRLLYSGHVPLVWDCWFPLLLIAADRWIARREWKWMLATAVLFSLQALATWYLAVMAALAVVLFGAWRLLSARLWPRRAIDESPVPVLGVGRARRSALTIAQATAGGLLVAAIVWPFASPYLALSGHEEAAPDIARRYAADVGSYVQPPEQALAAPLVTRVTGLAARRMGGERVQYLGFLTLLLAAAGAARVVWLGASRRGRGENLQSDGELVWGGYFLLLGLAAVALSFGPSAGVWMPFDLVSKTPVLGMFRVPSRFAVLVTLAVAGLAALGAAQLRRFGPRIGTLAAFALVPALLAEWAIVPPPAERPRPDVTPDIYRLVATADVHALVSLPCYRRTGPTSPLDADYMLYSTVHWRPIVNGYGRAEPPGLHWVVGAVNAFPGVNSGARLRSLGIDAVVLHAARYPDRAAAILAEARTSPDFRLVAQFGDDYLFRLVPGR